MLKSLFTTKGYLALTLSWAATLAGHIAQVYHTQMVVDGTGWEIHARFLTMTWIIILLAIIAWWKYLMEAIKS
jgi:hypothetical protein